MAELSTIDAVFLPKSGLVFTPDLARSEVQIQAESPQSISKSEQLDSRRRYLLSPPVHKNGRVNLRTALG